VRLYQVPINSNLLTRSITKIYMNTCTFHHFLKPLLVAEKKRKKFSVTYKLLSPCIIFWALYVPFI